jgi:hypothetical protein
MGKLLDWNLTFDEVDELVTENPSLQGMVLGYAAEVKLRHSLLADERFTKVRQPNPHDRTDHGDFAFTYGGVDLSIEVKSLQTASVREAPEGYRGRYQCDASDARTVTLPDGREISTTYLLVGEFDLLAVNLYAFLGDWVYGFAKNADLPRLKRSNKYPEDIWPFLLQGTSTITWPLEPPYSENAFALLDELAAEKKAGVAPDVEAAGIQIEKPTPPAEIEFDEGVAAAD